MAGKEASLTFEEYQEESRKTAIYPDKDSNFAFPALGLAGESGEVSKLIYRVLRDEEGKINEERRQKLLKELGDVLWYMSNLATELGLSLDEIAKKNLEKLASRQERGVLRGSGDER